MSGEKKTPYEEGYESAKIGDGAKTKPCPYEPGTTEYDSWWEGFGQSDDDYEWWNFESDCS